MKNWLLLVLFVFAMACKEKKVNLNGTAPVKVNDFVAAFRTVSLPFSVADTTIAKIADTLTISHAVFSQFIPDSVLSAFVDIASSFTIHPIGRIDRQKEPEVYLLAAITQNKKTFFAAFVLDKKNRFLGAKSFFANENNDDYAYNLMINKEPTFVVSKEKINIETKLLQFTRVGWVYNGGSSSFMVVVNDSNEDPAKVDVILNPVDTLPKKNPLSGDYVEDAKNFISLRDGKDLNSYRFFVHFEKKEGTCVGELKGEMKLKTPTSAVYNQSGDPCIIDFTFNNNELTLKEQGSCGNRRGIECYFNDTFTRKKTPKVGKK